jgi:hypothetical protein
MNTNQITTVALLQLHKSCMSQARFELWIGRRGGVQNIVLLVSYVLHKAKRNLASFEVRAATRVEDASNLAMETALYTETSVDCLPPGCTPPDARRRNIDIELVSCPILSLSPCSSSSCFYILLSS